jgi:hypothetical protein
MVCIVLAALAASAFRAEGQDAGAARDPDEGHVGPVTGAVAGVEVSSDSGGPTRRGGGLFVRCDGFLLVPSSLFLAADGKTLDAANRRMTVWVDPGSDHVQRVTPERIRTYFARDVPYLVIRIPGVHVPAARLLLPDRLRAGDTLDVVTCPWDPAAKAFGRPVVRRARLGAKPEGGGPTVALPFAEALEDVAPGGVVAGPEGMAVGVVCGAGAGGRAETFATFESFHLTTNCVMPVPTPDADFHGEAGMVRIKGARVAAPSALLREQPDMGGSRVACIRSFWIDRREVTNEEYYAFWRAATGQAIRPPGTHNELYPLGWEVTGVPFSPEAADLPVLGVPLEGAAAYARWAGKRLLTPFEWALAALGPGGEADPPAWVEEYARERARLWADVRAAHQAFLSERPELWSDLLFVGSRFTIPWIVLTSDLRFVSEWSKRVVDGAVDRLASEWRDPQSVLPGGSRRYDRTPEGADDLLLNAWEIVAPPRPFPAQRPSYYVAVQWPARGPVPNDPWQLLSLGPFAGVDRLPPLSRLIRRFLRSPSDEDLAMLSSLSDTLRLLAPVDRMRVVVGWDLQLWASVRMPGRAGLGSAPRPAGLAAWLEMPRTYRREMGRDAPLHTILPSLTSGANLHYLLPVGFRCAR